MTSETIKTRRQAFEDGEKHYYTGQPCKYGHVSKRAVASGACVQCTRQYSKTFARVKNGACVRLVLENLHPDDAAELRTMYAMLQASRDAVDHSPQKAVDVAKERARLYPDLKTLPPGHVFPPFEPHPGTLKKE